MWCLMCPASWQTDGLYLFSSGPSSIPYITLIYYNTPLRPRPIWWFSFWFCLPTQFSMFVYIGWRPPTPFFTYAQCHVTWPYHTTPALFLVALGNFLQERSGIVVIYSYDQIVAKQWIHFEWRMSWNRQSHVCQSVLVYRARWWHVIFRWFIDLNAYSQTLLCVNAIVFP